MKKILLILIALLVFTGCEKDEFAPQDPKIPIEENYSNEWTIEMTVSDVTPTGLKGKITHLGDNVDLSTGSIYSIEKLVDGEWTTCDQFCEPLWNLVAYHIPNNGSYEFEVNWEHIYGELPSGHYRISKEVTVRGTRLKEGQGVNGSEIFTENKMYYAEFDI